jgi:hypothetical protein
VSVLDPPAQIDDGDAVAVTVREFEPTVTVTSAIPRQLNEL